MKVLVTGAAGFIGSALVSALLGKHYDVVGLDNINSYYSPSYKYARLNLNGIKEDDIRDGHIATSRTNPTYRFIKMDITDRTGLDTLFSREHFDIVVNLAAQAGVRYSIENPYAYLESNVYGFLNILENCRHHTVKHLLYASSSSVYGKSEHSPNAETDRTDQPESLYAAMKKSDELMAYAYSSLYHIPTTGLRFFTVYGPWGRPDMAPFLFMKSILHDVPINVFNHGNLSRDFTYIDDIVEGMMRIIGKVPEDDAHYKIYNIGFSSPVKLMDFISAIEDVTGHKALMNMKEMQPGDVYSTYADTSLLQRDFGYKPHVPVAIGIRNFYEWFTSYIVES